MLHNTRELHGYKLIAIDGDIGHIRDFYFDDKTWVARYLVVDTGSWLAGRLILLTPHSFGKLDESEKALHVKLTVKQIEESPSIERHRPVSRQFEAEYYRYYGWPAYWEGSALWGFGGYPVILPPSRDELEAQLKHHHRDDKHLQSAQAVQGYHIQATDGVIGSVTGFMVDDRSWAVREISVESGHWYAGKEILINSTKVTRISYEESMIHVSLTREDIIGTTAHHVAHASADLPGSLISPRE